MSFDRDNIAKVILNNGAIELTDLLEKISLKVRIKKISELKMES